MKKRKNSNVRIVSPPPKRTGNQTLANEEEITSNDEITPGKKDETTAIDEATTGIIGHQFKMFKRLILDPTSNTQIWTSCGKNDEGAEMETAIERYMRTGHFLKPISAEDRVLATGPSYIGGSWGDTNRGKSYKQLMLEIQKVECFMLQCFPWTEHGKMIQAWSQSGPSTSDVKWYSLPKAFFVEYVECCLES